MDLPWLEWGHSRGPDLGLDLDGVDVELDSDSLDVDSEGTPDVGLAWGRVST